mmetsp:Transcript_11121/g.20211  ORF Transcript_11121/g.20211 Transcript_11121/m.20211 type:complete len:221 (-) Transcript_11121:191-853(-)
MAGAPERRKSRSAAPRLAAMILACAACTLASSLPAFSALQFAGQASHLVVSRRPGLPNVAATLRTTQAASDAESASEDPAKIALKLITPEGVKLDCRVIEVVLPGLEGGLGILRGHAPLVAPLTTGVVKYRPSSGEWIPAVVMEGYVSVDQDVVTVLSSVVEMDDDLPSQEDARKELAESQAGFSLEQKGSERLEALRAIKQASARLQAAVMQSQRGSKR